MDLRYSSSDIITNFIPTLDEYNAGVEFGVGSIKLYGDTYYEDIISLDKGDEMLYANCYVDIKGSFKIKKLYLTYALESDFPVFMIDNESNETDENKDNAPKALLNQDIVLKTNISITYKF